MIARIRAISRALHGAIKRNGLPNVLRFFVQTLRSNGVDGAASLIANAADRVGNLPSAQERPKRDPRHLSPSYSMSPEEWEARARSAPSEPSTFAPPSVAINLLFMVGERHTSADLERSLDSIKSLKIPEACLPLGLDVQGLALPQGEKKLPLHDRPESWVLYLWAGDVLTEDALLHCVTALLLDDLDVLTFDMFYRTNNEVFPIYLPGVNARLARALDHTFSRLFLRRRVLLNAPAVKDGPRAQLLAWLDRTPHSKLKSRWAHVFATILDANLTHGDINRAVEAQATKPVCAGTKRSISVIICTKDRCHLLRQLVRALRTNPQPLHEIIIVSNGTTNEFALRNLADLAKASQVQVLWDDGPFNFSRLANFGAKAATGDLLLFLNDDIVPISDDWLGILAANFDTSEGIGAIGPLLLYPDERVQHAGIYLGYRGVAGHTLRFARLPEQDYLFYCRAPREVSALTGAVMMVSCDIFRELNGFDERLATYLQDVDLCLRMKHSGLVNIFEPRSVLLHMESASLSAIVRHMEVLRQRQRELDYFRARWNQALVFDDLHNSAFDKNDESLRSLSFQ